jgi:class 3 adenylate cyclase
VHAALAAAEAPLGEIAVKIGLHRGTAIAVTSNRSLDFFGRTVNIGARVQGRAGAGEVLLTSAVLDDPDVAELLVTRDLTVHRFEAELRGLAGRFQLAAIGAS